MGYIQIYIADDDEDDRMFIKEAINNAVPSAKVVEALDGMDLLEKLQNPVIQNGSALILLDMNMPRLDGLQAAGQIKSDPKLEKIPIVMLSTSEQSELKQKAYALGIDSFITKPFTMKEYEQIIKGLKALFLDKFPDLNGKI